MKIFLFIMLFSFLQEEPDCVKDKIKDTVSQFDSTHFANRQAQKFRQRFKYTQKPTRIDSLKQQLKPTTE